MIGHILLLKWFVIEYFKRQRIKKKFFSLTSGNTNYSHRKLIDHLKKQGLQIEEVDKSKESEFIIFFCPVVSRAGTDIEAALKKLNDVTDTKPAILMVLHYTFNSECIVPESHRVVNRENTFTVDCLFHEDQGLLRCQKNEDSVNQVANYIKSLLKPKNQFIKQRTHTDQTCTMSSENTTHRYISNNYLILLADNSITSHKTFMKRLTAQIPNIHAVNQREKYNFILVFCPVVSRAGTDIQAALHKLNEISGTASAILVVLHHTFDPECIVPESHRVVNRANTFTVDCLFYEDQGLLRCQKNEDSFNKVVNKIKSWLEPEDLDQSDDQSMDSRYSTPSPDQSDDQSMDSGYSTPSSDPYDEPSKSEGKASTTSLVSKIVKKQSAAGNNGTKSSAKSQDQSADKNEDSAISQGNQQTTEKYKKNDKSTTAGSRHDQTQNYKNAKDETWESIADLWYGRSYWVF